MFTVSDSKYSDELIKLGFSDRLITTPEDCKTYLEHCNKYNMKFLKGSYGTLVHNDFDKYFKYIPVRNDDEYEIYQKIICGKGLDGDYRVDGVNLQLDHTNLFESKLYDGVYIVTSSPYYTHISDMCKRIENYPYSVYAVHPNFLDYHIFTTHTKMHPLYDLSYCYTNANDEQMYEIDKTIYEDLGLFTPFVKI